MASVGTDPGPAAQPEPTAARQACEDRPAVRAAGLAKSYGPTAALAGFDLEVAAGETVALLGPNGAGKSTAIGVLLGLLSPDSGQVRVYGRPPSQAVAAGLVGAMLQDAGLMPGVQVGELLAMVRGLYPRPPPAGQGRPGPPSGRRTWPARPPRPRAGPRSPAGPSPAPAAPQDRGQFPLMPPHVLL